MRPFPSARLTDLIRLERRPVPVDPEGTYREIGVYSFGRGIFHKPPRIGADVGGKDLFLIREGDLIFQVTFAWEGAVALAGPADDGLHGSTRFPTFRTDPGLCLPGYLLRYFQTAEGRRQLLAISPGSAGRNRVLSVPRMSEVRVPLPPLREQRRIVDRVDALAAKVGQVQELRSAAGSASESLLAGALEAVLAGDGRGWACACLRDLVAVDDRLVDPRLPEYAQLPHVSGDNMESGSCKLLPCRSAEADGVISANYLFSPDAVLYSKIRPYLRKATLVDFKGLCSADIYPVKVVSDELDPRFLMWSLVAAPFTVYANRLSERTRMPKLNRKQLFSFTLAYPSISEQRRIVAHLDALQAKVDQLKQLQAGTSAGLDALMPSILDRAFKGEL